jgi:hypothetical protein
MLSLNAQRCPVAELSYISKELPFGNFTQISTSLLSPKESGLTPKAIHLLTYLMGRPRNWVVMIRQLMSELKKGRHYIRTALLELQNKGHLYRKRVKDALGRFMRMETWVSQSPEWLKTPANGELCPGFDFPTSDYLTSENRTVYKQGSDKQGGLQKKQQLHLDSALESACESSLDYNERKLSIDCAILVTDLPKEELVMASEARSDIGYPSYERPIVPREPLKAVETSEAREQRLSSLKAIKGEHAGIAISLNQSLRGCVPYMDILGYLKRYGAERVRAAVGLAVERGINGKKNPGAYLSSAIRNNWAASVVSPIAEKHEEEILMEQKKYTLEENQKWWDGLTDDEKQKSFEQASWKHYSLSGHFSTMGISILGRDFSGDSKNRWAFSFLMEVLGRQADRATSA